MEDGDSIKNRNKDFILNSQQRFRSEPQNVYTEEINKTALSCNGEKNYNKFHVCENEMLSKYKWLIFMIIQAKIKQNIF